MRGLECRPSVLGKVRHRVQRKESRIQTIAIEKQKQVRVQHAASCMDLEAHSGIVLADTKYRQNLASVLVLSRSAGRLGVVTLA